MMGSNLDAIGQTVFGTRSMKPEHLIRHTLAGVYVHGMGRSTAAAWLQKLRRSPGRQSLQFLGLRAWKGNSVCSNYLRSCPKCVAADVDNRGFAAWKVLHQVPSLERCPYHGVMLLDELAPPYREKKDPPLWPLRLPTGHASQGSADPLGLTVGHAAYLALWPKLLDGELSAVHADEWHVLFAEQIRRPGGLTALRQRLERHIEWSWQASLEEVAKHLSLTGGESFVSEELELRTAPKDLARRLVVYSAAIGLGLLPSPGVQMDLRLSTPEHSIPRSIGRSPEMELRELITAHGFSIAMEQLLLDGRSLVDAFRLGGSTLQTLLAFKRRLSTDLLNAVSKAGNFSDESWLACELRRRSIARVSRR